MVINLDNYRTQKVIIAFLAVSAFYLFAGSVSAADPAPASGNLTEVKGFLAFDADGDGYIDAKEAQADEELLKEFITIDVDADGRVSMEEYNKGFAIRK